MNPKLLGVLLVICSCGIVGTMLAATVKSNIKQLNELITIINTMENDLRFRLTPLPALCRFAATGGKYLQYIFIAFAEEMENQISPDPTSCMDAALMRQKRKVIYVENYLKELARSLGRFDLDGQAKDLTFIRQRCQIDLDKLEKSKDLRIKNYQTISICLGIIVTILLF